MMSDFVGGWGVKNDSQKSIIVYVCSLKKNLVLKLEKIPNVEIKNGSPSKFYKSFNVRNYNNATLIKNYSYEMI